MTDTVFRPFEYTDEEGKFTGIDVDLIKAVAEDQNFSYELRPAGWDAGVVAVMNGQAHGLLAGATITQKRIENGWIFSEPYFNASQTFAVPLQSTISSYTDLKGKKVAVKNGTRGADFALSLRKKYGFKVKIFPDSPSMYASVINGECSAMVEDSPIMAETIRKENLPLRIPEGMESEGSSYGFVIMNKDNYELLEKFNAGLNNIISNGKYGEILSKYF